MICVCGMTSAMYCGKCGTGYCSRECQVVDWPIHKQPCLRYTHEMNFLSQAILRFAGSVYAMSPDDNNTIIAEFPQTIHEFIAGDSFHMVYLHKTIDLCKWEADNKYSKLPVGDAESIVFLFKDTARKIKIPPIAPSIIKKVKMIEDAMQVVTFTL